MDSPLNLDPGSPSSTTQADLPVPLKKFFQGKPLALGITQIFIGIIGIIFGIILDVADVYLMEYFIIKMPYWSGILYIISGSLAVAAARNPKIPLVQGALAMNVISALTAGIGIIFLGLTIPYYRHHFLYLCFVSGNESEEKCREIVGIIDGILAVLTVFNLLELCIATSFASFGCKMLCRNAFTETVVVIYQNAPPASAENPSIGCKEPESP
ncbi:membrane-spanning 4-domains subfamily A member 4A-like isoform X1 [Ahaetulla prasina]|uniref:membrane-spanning 4-domains subfamily A member 4A-like isoform X1 n=1 Tax=Ahaetulla prasina TaxID=499056 RepID=UPI002649C373|nr:membrane-spanning 4-domains subfamily A member 4A-like isoform X1 [Ahaetulla prasina]XP_058052438.1 membrane-spanning 4-domains subfamily A member 4A-like isoform X1 [Ahaetulla prasina]